MPPITLYRPVGVKELRLIFDSGMSAFPPRLDWQPIFYPVLNSQYAEQIARDWNTKDPNSDYAGFVKAFDVEKSTVDRYEVHTVGASNHQELWVPAEELSAFNKSIKGQIRVVAAYYGHDYETVRHPPADLTTDQLIAHLQTTLDTSAKRFEAEVRVQREAIYINYLYWSQHKLNHNQAILEAIAAEWGEQFPVVPLPRGAQQSGG